MQLLIGLPPGCPRKKCPDFKNSGAQYARKMKQTDWDEILETLDSTVTAMFC